MISSSLNNFRFKGGKELAVDSQSATKRPEPKATRPSPSLQSETFENRLAEAAIYAVRAVGETMSDIILREDGGSGGRRSSNDFRFFWFHLVPSSYPVLYQAFSVTSWSRVMLLHVPALSLLALSLFAPVQATSSSLEQAHGLAVNQSLLWGTYRPNLYFGLRPRGPRFLTGLMWFGVNDYTSFSSEFSSFRPCDFKHRELMVPWMDRHETRLRSRR